ncbi:MAG: hypothetical protein M3209_11195 [Acidobacteriota bacterium]|nr:hypothetical protein [Acidobacteriota bacterium]
MAEIQKLTAKLYTDSDLRLDFLSAPEKIGRRFNLTDKEIAELAEVLPEELNFFAESLFFKRLREVEKLLPRTKKLLSKDLEKYFREFSTTFLPASIKKHLEDAVRFADFLITQKIETDFLKDLIRFEQANLIFHGYGKNFLFRRFRFDVRNFSTLSTEQQRKTTISVWLRIGDKSRHFIW